MAGKRLDLAGRRILADSGPEDDRPGECGPAAHGMHGRAAREVPEVPFLGEIAEAPHPVPGDRVDHEGHQEAEKDEGVILDPFGDGSGHDGGGGPGEHELEEKLRPQGDAGPADGAIHALKYFL